MIFYNYTIRNCSSALTQAIDDDELMAQTISRRNCVFNQDQIARGLNEDYGLAFYEAANACMIQIYEVGAEAFTENEACKSAVLEIIMAYIPGHIDFDECEKLLFQKLEAKELSHNSIIKMTEITREDFCLKMMKASRNEYLYRSLNYWQDKLGLTVDGNINWFSNPIFKYKEELYEGASREKTFEDAKKILASDSFLAELKRIFSRKNVKKFFGHPVHYMISAGNFNAAKDMIDILVPALIRNGRLLSKRVGFIDNIYPGADKENVFDNVFSSAIGSTIVVNMTEDTSVRNYATGYHKLAESIGKKLAALGKDALFIFVDTGENSVFRGENLAQILGNGDIVNIEEGFGKKDEALRYLNDLAVRSEFSEYVELDMEKYLPDKLSFSVSDVYDAYGKWYGRGLKTHVYRAYEDIGTVRLEVRKKESLPYETLQNLVGLTEIKKLVDEIISFERVQKRRKELGLEIRSGSRHMIFYGNPGTAKTTVARLLAQIFKEEGILENGHVLECGRQDLVGRYVGWTAKIVEEKFRAARGGILFIDEAYSLVDDSQTFGAEAINTIVQLMENYRDEVIVVFAGYPDKMKEFVAQNEGLASRIAFHLNFPDYSAGELMGILDRMLKEREYFISSDARSKCLDVFSGVTSVPNFGNGRFVRNFLEQAELRQCNRLGKEYGGKTVGHEELTLIKAEDIPEQYSLIQNCARIRRIGY